MMALPVGNLEIIINVKFEFDTLIPYLSGVLEQNSLLI